MRWLSGIALLAIGCGDAATTVAEDPPVGRAVVARVGDAEIAVGEFDRMAAKLFSGHYKNLDRADEGVKEKLLDAMIGKELLLQEAIARGLDREADVTTLIDDLENRLLARILYDTHVLREVALPDEEVGLLFHEDGYDEEVRFSHIMSRTRAAAEQALEELRQGRSFELVASEKSDHRPSSQRQGDMGYIPWSSMLSEVRPVLQGLEIGEVHWEPVESRFGFHVFKLTGRRPVALEAKREIVESALRSRKRGEQISAYTAGLKEEYGLECRAVSIGAVSTGSGEAKKRAAEDVLCSWRGGVLDVGEYLQIRRYEGEPVPEDAQELVRSARIVAGRKITATEAKRLGIHDEEIRRTVARRRDELVVERLQEEVSQGIRVSEAEVLSFFESHPERYGSRPTVLVLEILVETEELAGEILRQLTAGEASMEQLAATYGTREATRAQGGRMWLKTRENSLLGQLAPIALEAPVGSLHGPLAVPGGFSLFRVEERDQLPPLSLDEVHRPIVVALEFRARMAAMDRLLVELREKYASRVQIFPEALSQTLRNIDLSEPGGGPQEPESQELDWSIADQPATRN